MKNHHYLFISVICLLLLAACNAEQDDKASADNGNRKSPIAIASTNYNGTYIKIVYGQPYKRNRIIFGDLVPYGEVWRTGANEATEITITDAILMGNQVVDPGTYALFTIPEEEKWTVILNHDLGQWGAFNYNEDRDYARMEFPVKKLEAAVEAFTIEFSTPEDDTTVLSMRWDSVEVNIPIRFY